MNPEKRRCRFCGHPIITFKDEYLGLPPDGRVYLDGAGNNEMIFHCPNCNDKIMYSMLEDY